MCGSRWLVIVAFQYYLDLVGGVSVSDESVDSFLTLYNICCMQHKNNNMEICMYCCSVSNDLTYISQITQCYSCVGLNKKEKINTFLYKQIFVFYDV